VAESYWLVDYVTLTAVPKAGYVFDNWSGHTEGTATQGIADLHQNPVVFQVGDRSDDNRIITANFAQSDLHYTVTASSEPSNGGTVQLPPRPGSEGYQVNQSISVFARAHPGYVFAWWSGDLGGKENPRTLLINDNKSITAVFNPTVIVYCTPSEGGSIALTPSQPSGGYSAGTQVTVTATPAKGFRFTTWGGDASGSGNPITVTVDVGKTLSARFAEEQESSSRWWLWVILGVGGLLGVLLILRLAYARANR
jgi:hypothetical protein